MTCSMIREWGTHWVERYVSFTRKISENPWMSAPFVTNGGISAVLTCAAKVVGCTTPFWLLFQGIFASGVAAHSALISPFQSLPTKRTTYQSLIKSTLHVAWVLRAGVINAIVFDLFKHLSIGLVGENRYLLCFWDVVSIVTILPVIANPVCSFTTGMIIVGGVVVISLVSKYIDDKTNTILSHKRSVPLNMSLIPSERKEPEPFFDAESKQYYFRPPNGVELNEVIEKYQVQGEYQGMCEGRRRKLKNLNQPEQPTQPCDVITLTKTREQIAFERNEQRSKKRTMLSIFFEQLENIRNCFALDLLPVKSFRVRMQGCIQKQEELANQLAEEVDHLLKTTWKDAYSSFLICGENELRQLGYNEIDAQNTHTLVLFYKPLPKM